ncbi:MAG TPA: hypothetical protein DCQ04_15155 [Actinobacteria bacterium]|nr:hypothetical protein [Actinomycetota bacterium]
MNAAAEVMSYPESAGREALPTADSLTFVVAKLGAAAATIEAPTSAAPAATFSWFLFIVPFVGLVTGLSVNLYLVGAIPSVDRRPTCARGCIDTKAQNCLRFRGRLPITRK